MHYKHEHNVVFPLPRRHALQTWTQHCLSITNVDSIDTTLSLQTCITNTQRCLSITSVDMHYKLEHNVVFPLCRHALQTWTQRCLSITSVDMHYKLTNLNMQRTQRCLSITSVDMHYKLEHNVVFPLPRRHALQTWTQRCLSITSVDMHYKLEHNVVFPLPV